MKQRQNPLSVLMLILCAPVFAGCCCCVRGEGSSPWPNFHFGGGADGAADDGKNDDNLGSAPKDASKDVKNAYKYAGQALKKKGYGPVKTANLRKDGTNWYVSGKAGSSDDKEVSYEVWFVVTRHKSGSEIREIWAAKTVKVNDEVVFP